MSDFQNPTIKESVTKLVDQGHDTVDTIKSKVSDVRTQVRETGSSLSERVTSYVNTNPIKAIGIAFGLGYIAMRIRTSPVVELAFLGAFGYGVSKVLGVKSPDAALR
jgi:hypothetical protein